MFLPAEVACALELIDQHLQHGTSTGYHVAIAADVADRPIAYCCYGPTPMTHSTWDLYWIATDLGCRGKGVASRVIAGVEGDVRRRGGRRVRLETSEKEGYGAARGLYLKNGYLLVGRVDDFYQPGDHLLTFVKTLG